MLTGKSRRSCEKFRKVRNWGTRVSYGSVCLDEQVPSNGLDAHVAAVQVEVSNPQGQQLATADAGVKVDDCGRSLSAVSSGEPADVRTGSCPQTGTAASNRTLRSARSSSSSTGRRVAGINFVRTTKCYMTRGSKWHSSTWERLSCAVHFSGKPTTEVWRDPHRAALFSRRTRRVGRRRPRCTQIGTATRLRTSGSTSS